MSKITLLTTPIGNLDDITLRAKKILIESDYFAVEDTRSFRELCRKLEINLQGKRVTSLHDHSEELKLEYLIQDLLEGKQIVVVSEAGSPAISDPAYPLIKLAIENNIKIETAPGVSSVITALELSGLAAIPFHFHGFLPREKGKKEKLVQSHAAVYGTHIYFEGVSRAKKTLDELTMLFPEDQFAVARELTKEYESIYRFIGKDWASVRDQVVEKGEFVILWHNPQMGSGSNSKAKELAQEILNKGNHPKKVSKLLSEITGLSNKDCYEMIIKSKG